MTKTLKLLQSQTKLQKLLPLLTKVKQAQKETVWPTFFTTRTELHLNTQSDGAYVLEGFECG